MLRGWLALAVCVACHREPERVAAVEPAPEHEPELARLRGFEQTRREATDFATLPPSDVALGADPYRIAALGDGFVGLVRGESAIVQLDRNGVELARLPAPRSPSGLAVSGDDVLVVGEAGHELAHYKKTDQLRRVGAIPVAAIALRDVAVANHTAYVVEEHDGRLLAIDLARPGDAPRELGRCHGAMQVIADGDAVAVDCLLDHTIEIHRGARVITIRHDGPMWRFAMLRTAGGLLLAAGGIEDHPLEREDGGFGYIDSFVYLYRVGDTEATRLAAINSSELGVVTPKWLHLAQHGAAVQVTAAGYASPRSLTATWPDGDCASRPVIGQQALVPGIADAVIAGDTLIGADPLLDAWVIRSATQLRLVQLGTPRPLPSRLGELLFFTQLMAPWSSSAGKLSRFTCETCHHEGYVDGRTHFTGRGTVHATTRPLLGLFNNRPYFSRALDKTMAQMVHAEFRVANRHNGRDPWFAINEADAPWLAELAGWGLAASVSAEQLRQGFMAFLMDFSHRANPAAIDHTTFTAAERAGAAVFRDRCASCHAARLIADDPASLVPFERWESLILSPSGPIVWSNAAYAQTGVTPYVHSDGARAPTLRRLYKKWPYFTNGHGRSLAEVVAGFAPTATGAYHEHAPAGAAHLGAADQAALLAFLDLL